jgi:hypothetical protein
MKMLYECIQDLRTIQNKYPYGSRGYESLRFAITILERSIELEEQVNPHWVLGEDAGSTAIQNTGNISGTITVGNPTIYWEHQ